MFKSILILVSPMIILFYLPQNKSNYFGEVFSITDLNEYSKINNETSDFDKKDVKIEGKILSSCPMKGCWMKIKADQDTILVRFKDYGFFVPKNGIEGEKAIVNGKISVETLSVKQLRHYAEDAGKSQEEINLIKDPQVSLTFLADGVYIENL
ncbi:MAG: DUF4920 domain-containing protein [Cytophagales bacterium]|nr:MAG: DUF4920 domain-containing protein [Rhodothermaeota bacterium MED-G18]|tara:strand:- start:510 stop:968 length:459 start_codon:yes stop_codon:yes gene_type:complete